MVVLVVDLLLTAALYRSAQLGGIMLDMDKITIKKLEAVIRKYKKNMLLANEKMAEVEKIIAAIKLGQKSKRRR